MTPERKAARVLLRRSTRLWAARLQALSARDFDTVNDCERKLLALRPKLAAAIAALNNLEGHFHGNA